MSIEVVGSEDLLETAKNQYITMQKSWWEFAKTVYHIKDSEIYKDAAGFETFKDFCEQEYPSLGYATMIKYCSIVENWGEAIEGRIKKDEAYKLPAYESCYRVITAKDVPKEEVTKLKKSVLDGRMSYATLKDRLKEIVNKARVSKGPALAKESESLDNLERELALEVGQVDDEFKDYTEEPEYFSPEETEEIDFDEADTVAINPVMVKLKSLNEMLPDIKEKINALNEETLFLLATELEATYNNIYETIQEIGKATGEED